MNDTPRDPHQAPLIQKKAIIPPGVLPRNMQTWVILAIAFVMANSGGGGECRTVAVVPSPDVLNFLTCDLHHIYVHRCPFARPMLAADVMFRASGVVAD